MSDSSRITVDTVYGKMVINRHDTIRGRSLIEYGKANDHPEIELLVELLKRRGPGCVAVDVGANFGCFTLAFAPHCKTVLSIEPQRELHEMFVQTLVLNATNNIAHAREASGRERQWMLVPEIDYNQARDFGSVRLENPSIVSDRGVIVRPLDELIGFYGFDRVDLLKIDVEGMEMDVLLGAEQTIARFHPILYVEYLHSDELALIGWIKAHGYDRVRKVGNNLLADPTSALSPLAPIVRWPSAMAVAAASGSWSQSEQDEWNRLALLVDRLTVIEELQGADNRAVERVQTRIGRSLSDRCPHGILLWLECGHCNTHVEGDLPTLLSPAALATLERLAESAPAGCFVEVGVFRGGSLQRLHRIAVTQGREVWGFDGFEGIKERSALDWIPVGHFDPGVPPQDMALHLLEALEPHSLNAHIVVGMFPECLDRLEHQPVDIAFAHVDCDQYRSVRAAVLTLWPRLVSGGIILCDDYDALLGAQLAVREAAFQLTGSLASIELTPEGKAVLRKP